MFENKQPLNITQHNNLLCKTNDCDKYAPIKIIIITS